MIRFDSILPEPSSARQGSTWRQWPVNGAANRWLGRLEVARATPLSDKSFPLLILSVSFFPLRWPSSPSVETSYRRSVCIYLVRYRPGVRARSVAHLTTSQAWPGFLLGRDSFSFVSCLHHTIPLD